jgi:hypothetical protein
MSQIMSKLVATLGVQYPEVNHFVNNAGYFGSTSTLDVTKNGAIQEMQVN